MRKYETVFLARQDIAPSQVDGLVATFSQILKDAGGNVVHNEYCGLKTLAYRIRKNRKAHYVLLDIESEPAALKEMERLMHINEDIIRFLTVAVDDFGTRPSALMQARYNRDDRSFHHKDDRDEATEESSDRSSSNVSAEATA